jgi:hypothetical protein
MASQIDPNKLAETLKPVPDQLLQEWNAAWTGTLIKLVILTLVLIGGLIAVFGVGNMKEVAENFPRYRCNPAFMPFAANFGYDPKENFNFCVNTVLQKQAAEYFGPIYGLLGGFTTIVQLIVDVTLGIRKLFSNFLLGINGFIGNVRDRIQGLLFQIRLSFMKLNNLMGRVYGTMYSVVWMGTAAMTAGFNIADNDLVNFLFEFCFDPETPVRLEDGSWKRIADVQIGDRLTSIHGKTPVVRSTFRFVGDQTPMVELDGVKLSAEHYVLGPERKWIQAGAHPRATPIPSIPELVCLNVSNHVFSVGTSGLIVADYDEHETPAVIRETQNVAMRALNGAIDGSKTIEDYSLGIGSNSLIKLNDGTWKSIQSIQLNDTVWNGGRVLGIVREFSETPIRIGSFVCTGAQAVFNSGKGVWARAATMGTACEAQEGLYHIITETCGTLHVRSVDSEYFIRDYREVALPEMEAAYRQEFIAVSV